MMGLSLATIDTDQTSVEVAKTMALAVNTIVLLLVQFMTLSVQLTFKDTIAMIIVQSSGPLLIALVFAVATVVALRMKLSDLEN